MPPAAQEIVERARDRQDPLGWPRGFNPAQLPFSTARWWRSDCRPCVSPAVRAVAHARPELPAGRARTTKALGHKQTGSGGQSVEQLAKAAGGRRLMPVRWDENIPHVTVGVHGPPEVGALPLKRDKACVELPRVTESPLAMPQRFGQRGTEFQAPLTH